MPQEFDSTRTPSEDLLRATNQELTYDAAGNLITVVETDVLTNKTRTSTLTYDAAGNLTGVAQT